MATLKPFTAPQQSRWHAFANVDALERAATQRILAAADKAIAARGAFHLVLAGGNTPRRVYAHLRTAMTRWDLWHVYFGDERCLPADDAERNSLMANEVWLSRVTIPLVQIHTIRAELGAEVAAAAYADTLSYVEQFDLVLLGLGEDGHTASLFPGHPWAALNAWPSVLPIHDAPKPPADRVSMSPARLAAAREVMFLVTGANKHAATQAWRAGVAIPASRITPAAGVDILLNTD